LLSFVVLCGIGAELLPPWLIQHILDDVLVPRGPSRTLVWLVSGLIGARVLIWMSEVGRGWLSVSLGGRAAADLRGRLHAHLEYLPIRFFAHRPVGTLMSRVTRDAGRLEEFAANTIPLLGVNALMLAGILVFLAHASWRLALSVLLPVPLIVVAAGSLWNRLKRALDRQASSWSRLSAHLVESLGGIQIIKAFAQEAREAARFGERNDHVRDTTIEAERTSFALFSVIYSLMNFGVLLAWYVGGRQVVTGELRVGVLMAVIAYLWMFYWPLQWLGQLTGSIGETLVGAERVFEILDNPTEAYDDPHALPLPRAEGRVAFRDVAFAYDSGKPVLREIDVEAGAGEFIGIVGRSGAGKTTLMNLLCRFYDVDHGAIEIDGVDIRRIRLEDLRRQIGIVAQDPFLFAGSIADNIRLGRPAASFEEVREAAIAANAHSFILARADGYDTQIGEGGHRLSGGEKQRIAIARAILRNPRILILDEATSLLDARSEAAIQQAVGLLARNRTTFVIAHRLTTVRSADRIIVLDGGEIVESGTHRELMNREGLYYRFVTTQREMRSLVASGGGSR
jgi:ATP-binding cassette subfamily B protein